MQMLRRLRRVAAVAILVTVAGSAWAAAQPGNIPKAVDDDRFSFGPPLRRNVVLAYRYTERVTTVNELNGHAYDSSERLLSYFITERQTSGDKKGLTNIEANIDSMKIEYTTPDSKILFNTQHFDPANPGTLKHREVFVPTVLVNHMVTFTLSPYGEVMKVASQGLDNAKDQAKEKSVPEFLRQRLAASTTDEYLQSVLLPWRGVAPLWRKVAYGQNVTMKGSTVLDRTSFRDTATVVLAHSPEGDPVLRFNASFAKPLNKTMTLASMNDPIPMVSGEGKVSGELRLYQDGVVHSGWSVATGTLVGNANGAQIRSNVRHEIYFESIGEFTFTSN
jgi:hypothetical protein